MLLLYLDLHSHSSYQSSPTELSRESIGDIARASFYIGVSEGDTAVDRVSGGGYMYGRSTDVPCIVARYGGVCQ